MNDDDSGTTLLGGGPPAHGEPRDGQGVNDSLPWMNAVVSDDASTATPPSDRQDRTNGCPHPDIATGRLVDEGEIARGGSGSIHRVYDTTLRRHIALKVLDPALATDPDYVRRFVQEARIIGALDHPQVVPVHDLATGKGGRTSYTMRLVDGPTLGALISQQSSRRDLERILQCLASVCDVLALAHSRGIVHRDIKPDNIMVGSYGEVYVMDWGCALHIGENGLGDGPIETDGTLAGTVCYMAPEQARGEISRIDARTDVFAVGAILYKALTGRAPYTGGAANALSAAKRGDYRAIDESAGLAVKPPPMLSAIAKKAMAIDPARRHASASALAEDLRDFLRGGNWFPLHIYAPGQVIVREGAWADAAYLITAGRCEVRQRDPADPSGTLALRVLDAGDVFGETAIFADAPRSASVVALEEVSAVVIDRASLEQLAADTYLGRFIKALARRFLEVEKRSSA